MVIKMCVIVDRKEINKSENFTCFELMVMQLCKYWSIDFWDMFAWRLSFSYCEVRSEKKTYFPICFNRNYNKEFEFIKCYLGLEIKSFEFCNLQFKDIVVGELADKKMVGILLDTYFCSWNEAYKKSHLPHFCLIIGYNSEYYYVCDTYASSEIIYIPKRKINEQLIKNYLLFHQIKKESYSLYDLLQNGFSYGEKYNNMNDYANILLDCKLSDVISEGELLDIKTSSTLRNIKFYSDDRIGFYKLLLKYSNILPWDLLERFSEIKDKWSQFLYMYIHILLRNDEKREMSAIGNILLEISEYEEKFKTDIMKFLEYENK